MTDRDLRNILEKLAREASGQVKSDFRAKLGQGIIGSGLKAEPEQVIEIIRWLAPPDTETEEFSDSRYSGVKYDDPIYGRVDLYSEIAYLRQIPDIRRLTRVKQLSFCYLTHIGAMHSRIEHMIGTSIVAREFCEHLKVKKDDQKVLSIAAFLHDIGHGPYGHSLEQIGELLVGEEMKRHNKLDKTVLDFYFNQDNPIRTALQTIPDLDINMLKNILLPGYWSTLQKENPELSYMLDIISSQVDADRIDYVARDTHHARPDFHEEFAMQEFIENSQLVERDGQVRLGYHIKAQQTIQRFLLYRRSLYEGLYLSMDKITIDTMISHALFYSLAENNLIGTPITTQFLRFGDEDLTLFLRMVGPSRSRMLIDMLAEGNLYQSVLAVKLPGDKSIESFRARIQTLGFKHRVQVENQISDRLQTETGLKVHSGAPAILISVPPYEANPPDEAKGKLEELEPTRDTLIITEDGEVVPLEKLWKAEGYKQHYLLRSFYLLVHPSLMQKSSEIKAMFKKYLEKMI